MQKLYNLIAFAIVVSLALIPPIDFVIRSPKSEYWLWWVIIAAFMGLFTLYLKTSPVVKFIAVAALINCFFSTIPYVSFTSYISVVLCCYFYIVCSKIDEWTFISKTLQCLSLLIVLLMTMQLCHKDSLLNFGLFHMEHYGQLGQHMQMGSFAVVLGSLLVQFNKANILFPLALAIVCHSSWSFLAALCGIVCYAFSKSKGMAISILIIGLLIFAGWSIKQGKYAENLSGHASRMETWKRSIKLANEKPLTGWGIGTYKDLFPPLSRMDSIPYKTAHNSIIQLIFEVGYPLTGCLLIALGWLIWRLSTSNQPLLLAGLVMLLVDSLVHFPDRMMQAVPLLILFFAYSSFVLRRYT